jgi:hypothetical protein
MIMKRIFAYTVVLFWVAMTALFVEREVIPGLYPTTAYGYAPLRDYARATPGYRMGIYAANGSRVGFSETRYDFTEAGDLRVVSNAEIDLKQHTLFALGGVQSADAAGFEIKSEVTVGPDNALKDFRINCDAGGLSALATGAVRNRILYMTLSVAGQSTEREIPVTHDDVVSSGFMAVGALPNLRVGQSWQIKMLDPLNFQFNTATARVTSKERILLRGHRYTTYRVELDRGVKIGTAWVNSAGDVLKEEAFGFVMVREPLPHEGDRLPVGAEPSSPPAAAQ